VCHSCLSPDIRKDESDPRHSDGHQMAGADRVLRKTRIEIESCSSMAALSLSAVAGCGSIAGGLGSSGDQALLAGRAVPLPDSGATTLANTVWCGEASCRLAGDVEISINEDPTFPAEIELRFDARGFPIGFFDGVLAVDALDPSSYPMFGLGLIYGMTGDVAPVPKRADFTPRSFDLAYTRSFSYEMMGASVEGGELATLEGALSSNSRELTGELRVTSWTSASYEGEGEPRDTGQRCAFALH